MTKAKCFDLAAIDTVAACNKPFEVEIRHPVTNEGTGVFISVLGRDSDIFRNLIRSETDDRLKRSATGKVDVLTVEKSEQKDIDGLVAVTTGWRDGSDPSITVNGEKLEFSPANARKLYAALLFVRQQVMEAVANLENFMSAS